MSKTSEDSSSLAHAFSPESKAAVYEVIFRRRDIRRFRSKPIPEEMRLARFWGVGEEKSGKLSV